jgi:polyhydroxyalkanoate synthase
MARCTAVRVERWALDEFPLPGRLLHEILEWLYRDNRFCAGSLHIGDRILGVPGSLLSQLSVMAFSWLHANA